MKFDDAILKKMYLEYRVPCDSLVSNSASLQTFVEDYATRAGQSVDAAMLAHHMLKLRKRGQANGGLSRLKRVYNGRN